MTIKFACGANFLESFMDNLIMYSDKRKAYCEQYGNVIKRKRSKKNISQGTLATTIGIATSTMSRYETGTVEIPASILPIICDICGFKFAEYMEGFNVKDTVEELHRAVSFVIGSKGAYPPVEWDSGRCKDEYDKLMKLLEVELKDVDYEDILVLGKIMELLERYKFQDNTAMNGLRLMAAEQLKSLLDDKRDMIELLSKVCALRDRI